MEYDWHLTRGEISPHWKKLMRSNKFILAIAVLVSACESLPEDQLTSSSASSVSLIVSDSASVVVSSNAEALIRVESVPLTSNIRVKTKIELTDPAMQFRGDYPIAQTQGTFQYEREGVYSNFKLFSFTSEATAQYKIALRVYHKVNIKRGKREISGSTYLYPRAYVMDREGLIVNDTPVSLEWADPSPPMRPQHLVGIWEGEIDQGETLYFLVAADNRHPGSPISGNPTYFIMRSCWTGPITVELSLDGS